MSRLLHFSILMGIFSALIWGCLKRDLSDYPGYLDPEHVRLFAYPGEWWEGHDVAEMPDGRYVATGVRDFAGDSMRTAIVVVSSSGDSLGVFYINDRARGVNVVSLSGDRVAVENTKKTYIVSPTDGSIEGSLEFSNFRVLDSENDALIYDSSSNSLITPWRDDGLCLHQVFLDGSDGWLACSGVEAWLVSVKRARDGYVVQGAKPGRVLLFKVNTEGEVKWVRVVDIPFADTTDAQVVEVDGFEITDDGSFLLPMDQGSLTPVLLKIDTLGNILWIKNYEHPGGGIDWLRVYTFKVVRIAPERYFLVATNAQCGHCVSVIKIDGDGNVLMAKNYFWAYFHWVWNVIRTSDGNILIVGTSAEDSTNSLFLLKLDPNGNPVW
ncbi:MAG: hypothetical protein GXO29_00455 [Thermotogae bacterium]|nr:hypothetical protein [Thermotogota bacterium]